MCDANNNQLDIDSAPEKFVIDFTQFKMEQDIFSHDPEKTLQRYFQLSIKDELCESELKELMLISEAACENEELLVLIELIDHHVHESRYLSDKTFLSEIEESRVNALNKIILGTETPPISKSEKEESKKASANKYSVISAKKKIRHFLRSSLRANKWRLMTISSLPLSILGLISIFHEISSETANYFPRYILPIGPTPEKTSNMTTNYCKIEAGWIDTRLEGRLTAYGKTFKNSAFTAAHEFLPPGSKIRLQSKNDHKSVTVEIIDRNKQFMLSYIAAQSLGLIEKGIESVKITDIEIEEENTDDLPEIQLAQIKEFEEDCDSGVSYSFMNIVDKKIEQVLD